MATNPTLLELAKYQTAKEAGFTEKVAVVPAAPPAGVGGAPPMDPAMVGGAPPLDPAMAGGAPPMDPAMAGGASPMPADPTMMGAAAGGMPPGGGMPMDPAAQMGAAPQKLKPEQMMQILDYRLYNMQQQLTALLNALDVSVPPGALVTPPGGMPPPAEAAMQGGPQDPAQSQGPEGEMGGNSAIGPIEPMQGASPELAMGGGEKQGGAKEPEITRVASPVDAMQNNSPLNNAEATAAMMRRLINRAS